MRAQSPAPLAVKKVRTNILEIGYHESGPSGGIPVILLHGFPDDAHAYDGVSPILAKAGHRALAVYLRGYGPTRFLDPTAPRTAEQAAIGQDLVDFADALQLAAIRRRGFRLGRPRRGRGGGAASERVRAACLDRRLLNPEHRDDGAPGSAAGAVASGISGTSTPKPDARAREEPPRVVRTVMARMVANMEVRDETYTLTAASFENPDFVDCVIHSYRHRNFNAPGEARFLEVEQQLAKRPPITVPTIVLHGGDDAFGRQSADVTAGERAIMTKLVINGSWKALGISSRTRNPSPWLRPWSMCWQR
jgi:pimeloyl-ACP methyl ester carboxylesterase